MKNRKLTALAAVILAGSAAVAGCGNGNASSGASSSAGGSSSASASSSGSAASDGERAMEGNMYVEGLPIVKETESFSLLVDDSATMDPDTMEITRMLEEQTNVHVNWMVYPNEVATEKRNILLNSGDYPDVIGGWLLGTSDIVRYGQKEGVFIPLEELFAQYAPNIEKVLEIGNVRRDMTLPDGHIYSPPYLVSGEPQVTYMQWINQTWLDNLNLKMPTTTDELYDVLKAFKEQDANGNGDPNDEIPLTSRHDRSHNWFPYFGCSVFDTNFQLINGEVVYNGTADYYKDGINYYAKLYKDGLIDPEIFTQDMTTYQNKGKAKDAVYGVFNDYWPNGISPGIGEDGLGIRNDQYVPLPPLTSPGCDDPMISRSSNGSNLYASQLVITDNAKNPATIVRWLNNVYELDNSLQIQWGRYGVTCEKIDDDHYRKMEKTEITGAPNYAEWIWALPRYVPEDYLSKLESSPLDQQNKSQNDAMDATWEGRMTEVLPQLWLTDEQTAAVATIQTDIANYAREKRAQWITGLKDVNAEWDEYKAQLEKLGLQTMIDVYTKAYREILDR